MYAKSKTAYHPYFIMAFYLQCLPSEWADRIPRSTRHDWRMRKQADLYGYEWFLENQQTFTTLQQVAAHRRLLRVNRELLRIIALRNFIVVYGKQMTNRFSGAAGVVVRHFQQAAGVLGSGKTLRLLGRPASWWQNVRRRSCHRSILDCCRVKHPTQLLQKEVERIKRYCTDERCAHWPLASVYYQMRRDGVAGFAIHTFYKYTRLLGLKRALPKSRRKNHDVGIRAKAPLHILHADATIVRTADNVKQYIYLVQDNFSRAILGYRVADQCNAKFVFENLQQVHQEYLAPAGIAHCQVITDDGSENKGTVIAWTEKASSPTVKLLTAQLDIEFSNSMIEAANKQLKYGFLYRRHIADRVALIGYLRQAIEDYNHRPHRVLNGLTPMEVLHGKHVAALTDTQALRQAREARTAENKREKCCFTF